MLRMILLWNCRNSVFRSNLLTNIQLGIRSVYRHLNCSKMFYTLYSPIGMICALYCVNLCLLIWKLLMLVWCRCWIIQTSPPGALQPSIVLVSHSQCNSFLENAQFIPDRERHSKTKYQCMLLKFLNPNSVSVRPVFFYFISHPLCEIRIIPPPPPLRTWWQSLIKWGVSVWLLFSVSLQIAACLLQSVSFLFHSANHRT